MKTYTFTNLQARPYPSVEEIGNPHIYGRVKIVVNVSDKPYSQDIAQALYGQGIKCIYLPLLEIGPDMGYENLLKAVRLLEIADFAGLPVIVHSDSGNNRSRVVAEAFHYHKCGRHLEDEYKGSINHLIYNCSIGLLPPIDEVEKALNLLAWERANGVHFSLVRNKIASPPTREQAIIDAWHKLEEEFGISIDDLETILETSASLSRLLITASNSIFLIDCERKPEIKLDDLTKALYFFYLHHPEGVAFKELQDHQEELLRIYQSISPRTDDAAMRRSIESLASPYSPSRDSSASRIRRAFRTVLGPHVSKNYFINGPSGAPRTIALPRDLVIWE